VTFLERVLLTRAAEQTASRDLFVDEPRVSRGGLEAAVAAVKTGMPVLTAARKFGVPRSALRSQLKTRGIQGPKRRSKFESFAAAVADVQSGIPVSEAAKRHGVNAHSVYIHLRKRRLDKRQTTG
jgi:transposase-like protein